MKHAYFVQQNADALQCPWEALEGRRRQRSATLYPCIWKPSEGRREGVRMQRVDTLRSIEDGDKDSKAWAESMGWKKKIDKGVL